MVKIYQPEENDFSKWFVEFLFFKKKKHSRDIIQKMLQNYLSSNRFKELKKQNDIQQIPDFIIYSSCSIRKNLTYQKNKLFPINYVHGKDEGFQVCSNFIKNNDHLIQNLEREILFNSYISKLNRNDIDNVISSYVRACRNSYQNKFTNPSIQEKATYICANINVKYGNFNTYGYPLDTWVRFVDKKVKEIMNNQPLKNLQQFYCSKLIMKEDSFLSNENDIESDEYTILLSERTEHKTNIENEIKYWKNHSINKKIFVKNFLSLDVDNLVQLCGGYGKFQKFLVFNMILSSFVYSLFDAAVPYWYYDPNYYCKGSDNKYYLCSKKQACHQQDSYFDYNGRISLISEFKLQCSNRPQIYLSLLLFVTGIGNSLCEILTDYFGRKALYIFTNLLFTISGIIGYFSHDPLVITIANSFVVICFNVQYSLVLVILSEWLPDEQRQYYSFFISFVYSLGFMFFNILNLYIKNYRTTYLMIILTSWYFLVFSFLIEETLYFLQSVMDIKKMYLNSIKVNDINKANNKILIKKEFQLTLTRIQLNQKIKRLQIKQTGKLQNQFTDIYDFQFFLNLFSMASLALYSEGMDKFTIIIMKDLGFHDIQTNGIVMSIANSFSFVFLLNLASSMRRKLFFNCSFAISLLGTILIYTSDIFISNQSLKFILKIIGCYGISISVFLASSVFWTYLIEIFETKNRMVGIGLVSLSAFSLSPILLFLKELLQSYDMHPLMTAIPCVFIAKIGLGLMRETVDEKLT